MRNYLFGSGVALVVASAALAAPTGAGAACPDDAAVKALAGNILATIASAPPDVTSIEDGLCAQAKLVSVLQEHWGRPVGYKAGLTSKAAQDTFKVGEPVRGVLLADMMLGPGAKVPAKYGALPRFEADMVVVVASVDINTATTPKEVLAALSAVHPFIELPDLVVASPSALDGASITAINVGARLGVLGAAIPVQKSDAFLAALADMTVKVTDQDGQQLVSVPGTAILGHPLNAVLWLRKNGITFKPGDIISLGSFGPLLAPKPGLTATMTYVGFPGDPAVSVTFE
jgi:2-keto-4-pentenoate hydratase